MRSQEVLEHLQKAGLFGGVVLVPVALAAQAFSLDALIVCVLGFVIYVAGLAVFGAGDVGRSHPDFARSGRLVCGSAYMMATVTASLMALAPGIKGEIVNRYAKEASSQIEALASKPGKSITLQSFHSDTSLEKITLVAGSVESQSIRLAPLTSVSEPFLGGMVDWVNRALLTSFQFAFAVGVLVLLIGIFILPRLPSMPSPGKGSAG